MNRKLVGVIGRSVLGLLGLLAVLFVAGVAVGYFAAHGSVDAGQALVWVAVAAAVLIMAGSLWVGAAWMRSIDEAAREAHKSAWYWGGTGGMAVGGVAVILATLPQAADLAFPSWLPDRIDPAAYAATGAMAMLFTMLVGYTIVWAWWWLARR